MWFADMSCVLQIFFQRVKTTAAGIANLGKLLFHVSQYDIGKLVFGHKYSLKNQHMQTLSQKQNQLDNFSKLNLLYKKTADGITRAKGTEDAFVTRF
jgi:hypothetical protein